MISTQSALEKVMQERKSVRKYKEGVEIPTEKLRHLLEQATSAPSSSNMQPWRFVVIQDQAVKEKMLPACYNQEQVTASSALIVVLGDMNMVEKTAEIYNANAQAGYMTQEVADNLIKNTSNLYGNMAPERLKNVIQFDAGLISMQIMLLARDMGYDTVPMGGFNPAQVSEILELEDHLYPSLVIAIGEAAAEAYGSSRLSVDAITRFI